MTRGDIYNRIIAYSLVYNQLLFEEINALEKLRISQSNLREQIHVKIEKITDNVMPVELCMLLSNRLLEMTTSLDLPIAEAELQCLAEMGRHTKKSPNFTPADLSLPENVYDAAAAFLAARERDVKMSKSIQDIDLLLHKFFPDSSHLSFDEMMNIALEHADIAAKSVAKSTELSESRSSIKKLVNASPDLDEISKVLDLDKI